jgi:hypothetical protein
VKNSNYTRIKVFSWGSELIFSVNLNQNLENMNALVAAHSGLRWIILLLLLLAIVRAFARKGSGKYEKSDKMINLFTMIFVHTQVTLGIVMAFISPKVNYAAGWMKAPNTRFFGMEHVLLMLIAAVVLTIGRKKGEKLSLTDPAKAHRTIGVWFLIALIIILAGIPWPFRDALQVDSWI